MQMNSKFIGVGLLAAVASMSLAACGGGGSSPGAATPPQSTSKARGTLTFKLPNTKATATLNSDRKPAYVSSATSSVTVFIDGVAPGTTGPCTVPIGPVPKTCSISFTTTPGTHTFAVEADNGTQILSEGTGSYTLVAGDNTAALALNPLTLNGVAASVNFDPIFATTGLFIITDAAGDFITQPGTYDNGPITITSSDTSVATITNPTSLASPGPGTLPPVLTATYTCSSTLASPAPFNVIVSEAAPPTPSIPLSLTPSLTYGPSPPPVLGTSPTVICTPSAASGSIGAQSHKRQ
jgi:hypothetical protein